ncbi:MAG: hypothetical protein CM1200mP14_16130 [Gammaproteobacteria bacterium]|nr:MAG: hypothetical protein CM1200mP14_16130 [Gammaproteobacteria bacterium]
MIRPGKDKNHIDVGEFLHATSKEKRRLWVGCDVRSDGIVITNDHVIADAEQIRVPLSQAEAILTPN